MAKMTFNSANSLLKIQKILGACELGKTTSEIAKTLYMGESTVRSYVRNLQDLQRLYVGSWRREYKKDGHFFHVAVYFCGNIPDKKKPRARTHTENSRIRRAKVKADPELSMIFEEKRKCKRRKVNPDELVNLFFGR